MNLFFIHASLTFLMHTLDLCRLLNMYYRQTDVYQVGIYLTLVGDNLQ